MVEVDDPLKTARAPASRDGRPINSAATHRVRREVALLLLLCLAVVGAAWLSAKLSVAVEAISSIWVVNGIVIAFVLVAPARWKATYFFVGQLANLGVDLALGDPLRYACWFALCNAMEIALTVLVVRHFDSRADIAKRTPFAKIVCFGIVLGPLVSAITAAPLCALLDKHTYFDAVRIWFLADALGAAVSLPLVLFLLTRERGIARAVSTHLYDLGLAILLVGIALGVFWQTSYPLVFLVFPPLMAMVFRFKLEGAVYGTSILLLMAAAFTAEGHGPFSLALTATTTERVILFQIFGFVVFTTCIPLGFLMQERDRFERNLKEANRRLAEQALLDPLTAVRNRRSFDIELEREWAHAAANGVEISLLYLDVDYFKRFNDSYGHHEGDECLRSVAQALLTSVRASDDFVARYGGEEFVILLSGASEESARVTANRVAEAIFDLRIPHNNSPFGFVTASIGSATACPHDGGDPYRLVRIADDCLYAAKRSGRHRVESKTEFPHVQALVSA